MESETIVIYGTQFAIQGAKLTKDMIAAIVRKISAINQQAKRMHGGETKFKDMFQNGEPPAIGTIPMDRAYEFAQLAKDKPYKLKFMSKDYPDQNQTDFVMHAKDVPVFNSIIEHMGILKDDVQLLDGFTLDKVPERESVRAKLEGFAARGQTEPPKFKVNEMDIETVLQARDSIERGDVENLTPDEWRASLELAATDYQYSRDNQDLIKESRPDATIVRSKTRWAELGRAVPDDAPQIAIRQPLDETGLNFQDIAVYDFKDTVISDRAIPRAKNDSMKNIIAQIQEKYTFEMSNSTPQDVFFDPAQNKILYREGLTRDAFFIGAQREVSLANSFKYHGAANYDRAENLLRADSVAYAACIKCGINPKGIDFSYIGKMDKDVLKSEIASVQKSVSGMLRSDAMKAVEKTTFKAREAMEMVK